VDECKPLTGGLLSARPATRGPARPVPQTRRLHSTTFRLISSAFRGTHWVFHVVLLTKTAQVELRIGRVYAAASYPALLTHFTHSAPVHHYPPADS
jgi:hypothetical protein